MTDLPTLKIGCGKLLPIHSFNDKGNLDEQVPCGKAGKVFGKRVWYCNLCQHNFNAVKAHATEYQKEYLENAKSPAHQVDAAYAEVARDAVLKLAGLTEKDLEGELSEVLA